MSKKREIRATYAAERQGMGPTKWGCLPLLALFWALHLVFLFGEFLARIWRQIRRWLWGMGLSYLLWSPIYDRIKRSWLGFSLLAKFGFSYYAQEPEKIDQLLYYLYVTLNSKK